MIRQGSNKYLRQKASGYLPCLGLVAKAADAVSGFSDHTRPAFFIYFRDNGRACPESSGMAEFGLLSKLSQALIKATGLILSIQ